MKPRIVWALCLLMSCICWIRGISGLLLVSIWLLLLPLLSTALNWTARKNLTASLTLPVSADKKETVEVSLLVKNTSRIPIGRVQCRLLCRNELTGEQLWQTVLLSVPPRGSGSALLQLRTAHSGYLRVTAEKLCMMDWFGLFSIPTEEHCAGGAAVLPELFSVQAYLTVPPAAPEDSIEYSPYHSGNDKSELFQLRDYHAGDSLNTIHWKLSGKLDRLIVKEAALPVSRSVLVFWDRQPDGSTAQYMDALADTTASLCQALSRQGICYHLGWNDGAQLQLEEINSTDEFLACLPRMLRCHGEQQSGCHLLTETGLRYGKILYLSTAATEECTALAQQGELTALLCGAASADAAYAVITIHPETYREDFQTMELDA